MPTRNSKHEDLLRVLVRRIRIRNFKSIRSLDLELKPGINVLVGSNSSGKTNILEAIHFMYKALVEAAEKTPYRPHAPAYWSPLDIIYGKDPGLTVELGMDFDYYWRESSKASKWYRSTISFTAGLVYDQSIDTLVPEYYTYVLNGSETIRINRSGIEVSIPRKDYEEAKRSILEKAGNRRKLPSIVKRVFRVLEKESQQVDGNLVYIAEWDVSPPKPLLLRMFAMPLGDKIAIKRWSIGLFSILGKYIPMIHPTYIDVVEEAKGASPGIPTPVLELPLFLAFMIVVEVLRGFTLLKHPDIGVLGEPVRFTGSRRLEARARNLAEILLALQGRLGGFPERVSRALAELFPGFTLHVESRFGRVALIGEENGLELPPPNLPDGLVKLVTLMTAAELNPTMLLIDELENSMHARLLEYVVDELNNLGIPVLVATHSPIIVDLVDPGRVLVVERSPEKGTFIETIRDPERLARRLAEEGISLSNHIFYGRTWRTAD